jgi:hypothetical protein
LKSIWPAGFVSSFFLDSSVVSERTKEMN